MGSYVNPNCEDSDAFSAVCLEHEVAVVEEVLDTSRSWTEEHGTPTGVLAAVKNAGRLLRKNPDRPLADSLINPDWGFNGNVSTQTLIQILNSSVERPATLGFEAHFTSRTAEELGVCSYAELGFLRTVVAA